MDPLQVLYIGWGHHTQHHSHYLFQSRSFHGLNRFKKFKETLVTPGACVGLAKMSVSPAKVSKTLPLHAKQGLI